MGAPAQLHLAMQTYDLVDKHIQRLDKSLKKYEDDVEQRTFVALVNSDSLGFRLSTERPLPTNREGVGALSNTCLNVNCGYGGTPDAAKEGLKLADLSAIIGSQAARARTKGGQGPGSSHKKGAGQQVSHRQCGFWFWWAGSEGNKPKG